MHASKLNIENRIKQNIIKIIKCTMLTLNTLRGLVSNYLFNFKLTNCITQYAIAYKFSYLINENESIRILHYYLFLFSEII